VKKLKPLSWISLCFFVLCWSSALFAQEKGIISGVILDRSTGETLIDAGVEVVDTGEKTFTDLDGKFRLELPEGTYEIRVFYPQYQGQRIQNIVVNPGKVTLVDVSLSPKKEEIEVVEVVVEAEKATEAAQILMRKKDPAISDRVSAETIAKQPDPDVASVVERAPGTTVVDDKYVFVRGLGERYSAASLDNSPIATTEPERKVVPLNLFPSSLVESVNITKTYTPNLPGEFSGGLVQIETKNYPETKEMKLSASLGYNSQTTGKDMLTYKGGKWDWLGFDDGTRELPSIIPDAPPLRRKGIAGIGYTPEELQVFGRAFHNIWNPYEKTAPPNWGLNASFGNKINKFGYAFNISYDQKYEIRPEDRIYYKVGEGEIQPSHNYKFDFYEMKTHLSAILNLGYEFSPEHKILLKNLYTRKAKDEVRFYEGFNDNLRKLVKDLRLYWTEESVFSSQLSGEHLFSYIESRVDWRLHYSRATLDEPDLREVLYEFEPSIDAYTLANVTQSGSRLFTDLDEDTFDGALDWNLDLKELLLWDFPFKVKFGPAVSYRDRVFDHRRFRFTQRNITSIDLTQDPESLFSPGNIRPNDGFEISEETRPTDHYEANHLIAAAYGMIDTTLWKKWRLVTGLRIEYSDQELESAPPFDPTAGKIFVKNEETDLMPSVNLIYGINEDMNLRLSFAQTVNRPEFRELAPFEFTDVHGAYATVGNPDLKRALIQSYDIRWEWFLGLEELFAVSLFYKDFTDPIEKIVQPTIQLRSTWQNSDAARNLGIELEARKNLDFIHRSLSPFSLFANYTYVNSKIELDPEGTAIMTSKERPLQGQADHIANVILEYRHKPWDFTGRLLYNYVGKRITEAGAYGLPDIIAQPTNWLDIIFIKQIGNWGIKLAAKNLLDQEIKLTQGGNPYQRYRTGISVTLGVFAQVW
jgi:outer membrane receptor protein involved in Fe transport